MSFSLDTTNFPHIATLEQAEAHWRSKRPWNNMPLNTKPLDGPRKKHCQLIKVSDTEYRARLHSTDVITYTPDGLRVDAGYPSPSTDKFIHALLRRSGCMVMTNRHRAVAWRINRAENNGSWYNHGQLFPDRVAIFDREFNLTNPLPTMRLSLNRKKTKEVRTATGFNDFVAWRKAYETMNPEARRHPDASRWYRPEWRPDRLRLHEVTDLLKERGDAWIELAMACSDAHILDQVHRQHPEVVQADEVGPFANYTDFENWLKLDSKYGWAIRY